MSFAAPIWLATLALIPIMIGAAVWAQKRAKRYAVRFTASGGQRISAAEPAEILVWEMHAAAGTARYSAR